MILVAFTGVAVHSQTLDDYCREAAANNPGLRAEYKRFEAATQATAQVSSLPDPTVSFGYFVLPVETRVGPQRAKLSLTQTFPWFGTLRARGDATSFMAESKYQEYLDDRNRLYYQVATAYYALYELFRHLAIEEANVEILSSYKVIATANFQNGKGAMVDVLRVDILLKDASTKLSILNKKRKPLESRFNRLLNRDDTVAVVVQNTLSTVSIPPDYRRDSLLQANPQLDALDLKIKASDASKEVAILNGLPKIGVGVDYVVVGTRTGADIVDNGQDVLMPMVSVSLPIYRSRYEAAQHEAQLLREAYALQKEEVSNMLSYSYDAAWYELQKQFELVELFKDQIEESTQSLTLLMTSYSTSGAGFEEVLRMQQQVLSYQRLKATAIAAYFSASAELDYFTSKAR